MADLTSARRPGRPPFLAWAILGSIAAHGFVAAWLLLSAHPLFRLPSEQAVQITLAPRWLFEPAPARARTASGAPG